MTSGLLKRARHCARASVLEPLGLAARDDRAVGRRVLAVLSEAEAADRPVYLRELHHLTGLPQPDVLRAARLLQESGKLTIEQMIADPLAGRVQRS